MEQPDLSGDLAAETLYSFNDSSKVANPTDNYNLFGAPSLTPGIPYPISEREERIRQQAYKQGDSDRMRMNRAGHLIENDPFLEVLRERVEQIRKEKIKKGRIEPANEKEERWVR